MPNLDRVIPPVAREGLLPEPEMRLCYFDERFTPALAAMELDWPEAAEGGTDRLWLLPGGLHLIGPAPIRFGVLIQRVDERHYTVLLVWDELSLRWSALSREELKGTGLAVVLAALKSDLCAILDQPVTPASDDKIRRAA